MAGNRGLCWCCPVRVCEEQEESGMTGRIEEARKDELVT